MAYTSNPRIAKVRRQAVQGVRIRGLSFSEAGMKYGVTTSRYLDYISQLQRRLMGDKSVPLKEFLA